MDNSFKERLSYIEYLNRENNNRHHHYDEEMLQYRLLKDGEIAALEEGERMLSSNLPGHVSDDPVRNYKYLFVASITLATRAAIEGGMDEEKAYNISDLYIQEMDKLGTVGEVKALHKKMFECLLCEIRAAKTHNNQLRYSKPVQDCLSYIDLHLHERIMVSDLADEADLNPNYLSTLFKKEVGVSPIQYIKTRRIAVAKNMLLYSDSPISEISTTLAFDSQSHFTKVFRETVGITPSVFRSTRGKRKSESIE